MKTKQLFPFALLAIVAMTAVIALSPQRARISTDYVPQSITRVNDLEITGTTNGSGVITARSGVRLTTVTTGPIFVSGTGSPNGVLAATQGSMYLRTDTAQIYQNTDGAMAWTQIGTALASQADSTLFGRAVGAGAGTPGELTATQATAMLDTFTAAAKGLAPAPVTATGKFLRDDATWQTVGGAATPSIAISDADTRCQRVSRTVLTASTSTP